MGHLELTAAGNYVDPEDPGELGYASRSKRRSVTIEEAAILSTLAAGLRVLELGTGLAVSTAALAEAARAVVTVDPDPWVTDPKIPGVTFMRERPPAAGFDLAFIDANHTYEAALEDIRYCRPIRLVLVHDTYLESVARAIIEAGLVLERAFDTRCALSLYRWS